MKKHRKALIFVLIIALGVIVNKAIQGKSIAVDFSNLVNDNYLLSVILYLIFTIVGSSLLALPGVSFAVISSGMFGPWLGSLYCLIGTTIGAVLSFLLGRYLLKDSAEELVKKNGRLYNIIFQTNSEKEILILMITRLLPIFPFNLQNYAYGITNISISTYTIGTFLFMIPGIVLFSIGTEGVINEASRNSMFIIAGVIVVLMIIIGILLYKKYITITERGKNEG